MTKLRIFSACLFLLTLKISTTSADYQGQEMPFELLENSFSKEYQFSDPFLVGKSGDPITRDESDQKNSASVNTFASTENNREQQKIVSVRPGEKIDLILDRAVGSGFSEKNDFLYGKIINPEQYDLPEGSLVEIVITDVKRASRFFAKPGKIKLEINRIILSQGKSLWVQGELAGTDNNQYLAENNLSSIARSFGKLGIAAGTGALGGLATATYGYDSDRKDKQVSRSILVGASLGTVVGGVWIALSRGKNITLPAGMKVTLMINNGAEVVY